jgi:short-subunit dehydrogenase
MLSTFFQSSLITGASSGLGAAFAKHLAKPGSHLVLVARRSDRLKALSRELEKLGATVEALVADLATEQGIRAVEKKITDLPNLDLLINNAGFGVVGPFAKEPLPIQADMLRVHDEAPMRLTYAALQGMLSRKKGAIINVASTSAYAHNGEDAMYCATKAFLVAFSDSLHEELHGTGVKIQALCPGFTHTEFHEVRDYIKVDATKIPEILWMKAGDVAAYSLNALRKNRVIVVPGWINKVMVFLARNGLLEIFRPIARSIKEKSRI